MGAYNLWQSLKKKGQETQQAFKKLLVTGFVLSIDNLVVGFALSLYRTPIFLAAALIATVSVAMSLTGLELGDRLGERFEKWSEEAGAAVLILVGVALLLGWL